MIDKLDELLNSIQERIPSINQKRLSELDQLALHVLELTPNGTVNLQFICTHNSRRSQIAELMVKLSAEFLNLSDVSSQSAGTEETALNHRVVTALKELGMELSSVATQKDNPIYEVSFREGNDGLSRLFSKVYDHESLPTENAIAVMVCDHAAENCPFIPHATVRFPLTYKDPKWADDMPNEIEVYKAKVKEIGAEMFYLMQLISEKKQA